MWNGFGVLSLYLAALLCQIAGVQAQGGGEAERAGGKEPPEVPAELITALGHEKFKERHAAQKSLMAWGRKDLGGSIESLYRLYRNRCCPGHWRPSPWANRRNLRTRVQW